LLSSLFPLVLRCCFATSLTPVAVEYRNSYDFEPIRWITLKPSNMNGDLASGWRSRSGPAALPARWLLTITLALVSVTARSGCLPLPDPETSNLDARLQTSPQSAVDEADARLRGLAAASPPLVRAQLYAVIAESNVDLNRTDAATAAIARGLELLQSSPGSAAADRVRLRLKLLQAELLSTSADGAAAGAAIDRLLTGLPDDSLDLACALSERAIAYDFADQPDRAVNAALIAHRLAVDHGWLTPRIETAYTLAVNFRRAGLYDRAEKMIDEVISLETANHELQSLADAYYERGQLLVSMSRYSEARAALAEAKHRAAAIGDRLGAAAANIPLCLADLNDHDLSAAESTCNIDSAELIAGNRLDLAMLLKSYQARLDLDHHRPEKALATLNEMLGKAIHRLLPVQESRIYGDRAEAHRQLHQYSQAFADLAHAQTLDAESQIAFRHRQVAVLGALIESERLRANNRLLQENLLRQQQDLLQQKKARLLWAVVAATSGIVCVLLVCLSLLRKRHTRRLRRYDFILSNAWSRAPHAMVMLDENRLVCFANRPLFGLGDTPAVGAPLADTIPLDLLQQITQAIDRAFDTGRFQILELESHQGASPDRYYEVLVLPAMDAGDALGVAIQCIDVTELRAMERQFLDGTSHERLELGGELHEELAQELAGVLLMLTSLSAVLQRESGAGAHLAKVAAEQLARSIGSVRRMARDLAPVRVERGSLADALQRLAESGTQRLGATVACECVLDGCAIADVAADHVHQFCRAALIECALVDRCHRIQFQLRVLNDALVIRVSGERQTMPAADSPRNELLTKMIVFRARLLGGRLTRGPNSDTSVCVTLAIPVGQLQEATRAGDRRLIQAQASF